MSTSLTSSRAPYLFIAIMFLPVCSFISIPAFLADAESRNSCIRINDRKSLCFNWSTVLSTWFFLKFFFFFTQHFPTEGWLLEPDNWLSPLLLPILFKNNTTLLRIEGLFLFCTTPQTSVSNSSFLFSFSQGWLVPWLKVGKQESTGEAGDGNYSAEEVSGH